MGQDRLEDQVKHSKYFFFFFLFFYLFCQLLLFWRLNASLVASLYQFLQHKYLIWLWVSKNLCIREGGGDVTNQLSLNYIYVIFILFTNLYYYFNFIPLCFAGWENEEYGVWQSSTSTCVRPVEAFCKATAKTAEFRRPMTDHLPALNSWHKLVPIQKKKMLKL